MYSFIKSNEYFITYLNLVLCGASITLIELLRVLLDTTNKYKDYHPKKFYQLEF